MNKINEYVKVVPNERQYALQKMGFYAFIHFGINTFADKEWSDGSVPASAFNPTNLDTDNWCECVKSAGMKAIILTAKHHDGFCLWQTNTTEYSIKNSPYKDGKGDIVQELATSCKKYGLKFGVYLSPWDRNSEYYGTPRYNDFYIEQLTELLTNYGDIFELWLDGACGAHLDGKAMQVYDFRRIYETTHLLQPNCIISNCGPDVRWIGNEGGLTRDSEWNVLPACNADVDDIIKASQQDESATFNPVKEDLGSREVLKDYKSFVWYPAEVDVSIRPGWFYHASQDKMVRSVENLLDIYYSSVGGNAMLLLNVPPDTRGLIAEPDAKILKEMGERIASAFATEVKFKGVLASQEKADYPVVGLRNGENTYSPVLSDKYVIDISFKKIEKIDKVVLSEDVMHSQRIEKFDIFVKYRGRSKKVYSGTTVGMCKIALFKKWTYADGICILIHECRNEPFIKKISVYESDGKLIKQHALKKKLKKKMHALSYKMYLANLEANKKRQQRKEAKMAKKGNK